MGSGVTLELRKTGIGPRPSSQKIRFEVPEDGLPSIEDWVTTFTSILLDGLELQREPLDVCVGDQSCFIMCVQIWNNQVII